MSFSGVLDLLTGLWEDIRNSRQNRSTNKLVSENAVTRVNGRCFLRVMSSGYFCPYRFHAFEVRRFKIVFYKHVLQEENVHG